MVQILVSVEAESLAAGASRDGHRYYGAIDPRRSTGLALGY